jgi:hypothetical protein
VGVDSLHDRKQLSNRDVNAPTSAVVGQVWGSVEGLLRGPIGRYGFNQI